MTAHSDPLSTTPKPSGFRVSEQTPDFWLSFLKTAEARDNPVMARVAQALSERPWLLAEPLYEQEKGHFYSWFADAYMPWPRSSTAQGDAVSDLTAYHEWLHMLTLPRGYPDPLDWMTGVRANESQVSIETEILAHARLPGLQRVAFSDRPLWVDRLVQGKEALFAERPQDKARMERALGLMSQPSRERDLYEKSGGRFLLSESADEAFWGFTHRDLWALRRGVALWPDLSDPVEAQLGLYESMSDAWLLRWAGPAQEIELRREALQNQAYGPAASEAIGEFKAWMESQRGPRGIPFELGAFDGEAPRPVSPPPSPKRAPKA